MKFDDKTLVYSPRIFYMCSSQQTWISENLTDDFQNDYIVDAEPDKRSASYIYSIYKSIYEYIYIKKLHI